MHFSWDPLMQVSAPESSHNDDEEAQKAKGEDLLQHIGESHRALPYRNCSAAHLSLTVLGPVETHAHVDSAFDYWSVSILLQT